MSISGWVSRGSQASGGAIGCGNWMWRDERRSDQTWRGKQKQRDEWMWQGVQEWVCDWRGGQKQLGKCRGDWLWQLDVEE